jgi:uncharacterized LabA/DUF88 family protein
METRIVRAHNGSAPERPGLSVATEREASSTPSPVEPGFAPSATNEAAPDAPAPSATRRPIRRPAARPRAMAETAPGETVPADSALVTTDDNPLGATATEGSGAGDDDATRPSRTAGRSRAPRRSPVRRPAAGAEAAESGRSGSATGAPTEFEPMPPPTKRKAPRAGIGITRIAQAAENAVDWALGRTLAEAQETTVVEPSAVDATALPVRRRRSRRGHRGRGGGDAGADSAEPVEAPAEDRTPTAPMMRPREVPARPAPRDGLSQFESLVARQNVVLDALLAKVSSFATMEHALMAIERRLSSQGFGASGTAAPRVGIFVDVPNIIYAAERIGVTINFEKLLHMLTRGRELVRASAYAPISDDPMQRFDAQKFVQPFVRRGYRIVTKPLKRFSDGTMKGNFDVELAMDILMMADRLDVISLVSGDGDFSRLVEIVGSKGLRVEVVAFGSSTSSELRAICDDYIDISDHLSDLT